MIHGMEDWPDLNLNLNQIPEAKNWKIGEKYKLEIEVEQLTLSKTGVGFKIVGIKPYKKEGEKEPSEMNSSEHRAFMARQKAKDYNGGS